MPDRPENKDFYNDDLTRNYDQKIFQAPKASLSRPNLEDDADAREKRFVAFEKAAFSEEKEHRDFDHFQNLLEAGDSVIEEIECLEISGLPSYSYDNTEAFHASGKIKLAIVQTEKSGIFLLCSVAEGTVKSSIKENFSQESQQEQLGKAASCCCFMSSSIQTSFLDKSSVNMEYVTSRNFQTQFFLIPWNEPIVMDAMCFRSSKNMYAARTQPASMMGMTEFTQAQSGQFWWKCFKGIMCCTCDCINCDVCTKCHDECRRLILLYCCCFCLCPKCLEQQAVFTSQRDEISFEGDVERSTIQTPDEYVDAKTKTVSNLDWKGNYKIKIIQIVCSPYKYEE